MQWETQEVATRPSEILLRQTAVGLNYIDVYFRRGSIPHCSCRLRLDWRSGSRRSRGGGGYRSRPGDHVGYAAQPLGAYAESRLIPADRSALNSIEDRVAAAMMLKGMTVQYLCEAPLPSMLGTHPVPCSRWSGSPPVGQAPGCDHDRDGWLRRKAALAQAHGCTHTILYNEENFVEGVQNSPAAGESMPSATQSAGIPSIRVLTVSGCAKRWCCSGKVPARWSLLIRQSCRARVRFSSHDPRSLTTPRAERTCFIVRQNFLTFCKAVPLRRISIEYPLIEGQQAHKDLEARKTTGATLLP